jgi:hypothetical protein
MTPTRTFGAWLRTQDTRHDGIGDLAKLAVRLDWPGTDEADAIARRLVERRATGDRFAALVDARAAWRQTAQRTAHMSACPWCAFEAGAATRETADRTLVEHLKAKHRVRYAFWLAGVLDAEGHIRSDAIDADGMVHLPAVWHGRRDWQ